MRIARTLGAFVLALMVLVAGSLAYDGDSAPDGSPVPSDPVFKALLTDGTSVSGRIRRLGPDGNVVLVGETDQALPLERIVSLTREGEAIPTPLEGTIVLFPDGDRLRAIINSAGETDLETLPGALGDVSTAIPLDSMLGVLLQPPSDAKGFESILFRLRNDKRNSEVLWLSNGDRLTGSFLGLSADKVEFQPAAGKLEIPRSGVIALGFDPGAVNYPKPEGPFLELSFTDGSRLGVSASHVEQGHLAATSRFGAKIRPPLGAIAKVHVRSDAVAYLSERAFAADQYLGYLGRHPETFGRNSTWDGHPLRLAGQPYDRGLGMLPRTLVAYKLEPNDKRFQALIGLDDRAGEKGSVVFRVLVDNKERFISPSMAKRDAPVAVDIDVSGAKVLILATEFGEGGDVQDSADWIEARMVR